MKEIKRKNCIRYREMKEVKKLKKVSYLLKKSLCQRCSIQQENIKILYISIKLPCCSVTQSYMTLCDPMDYSMPGFPILYHLPEFVQTHAH